MGYRTHFQTRHPLVLLACDLGHVFPASLAAQEVNPGRWQFLNACGTCYVAAASAKHRQGPNLHGVFGQKAVQAEGFAYSQAMRASGLIWDEPTLDAWLTDAQAYKAGVTMLYRQANPERRQLVIECLKTLK